MLKFRLVAVALTLIAGAGLVAATVSTQEGMLQPMKQHKRLLEDVGTWEAHCKFYMAPDQPPMEMTGKETVKALGPFWVVSEFEGDMMGMTFNGLGTTGYDPEKKKYVGTWIDSMTQYVTTMEGVEKDGWIVFDYEGKNMMGETVQYRSKFGKTDEGRMYKSYMVMDGKEEIAMEIVYKRK